MGRQLIGRSALLPTHAAASALVSLCVGGCVFDLEPLREQFEPNAGGMPGIDARPTMAGMPDMGDDDTDPLDAGGATLDASIPRDSSVPRDAASDADVPTNDSDADSSVEPIPCEEGQFLCNDECLPSVALCPVPCVPECELPNAEASCSVEGVCELVACATGFVDCDGLPENGCEADFNFQSVPEPTAPPSEAPPLPVPTLDLSAGSAVWYRAETWSAVPLMALAQPCQNCQRVDDETLEQPTLLKNRGPGSPEDLAAGFALAWHGNDLYVRVLVRDDQRLDVGEAGADDPRGADNVEFLFDGDPTVFGADDRHLFVDFAGTTYDKSFGGPVTDRTEFHSESSGQCTTLTGRLTGQFLTLGDGRPLQLEAAVAYRFNIAINDYDFVVLAGDAGEQRERQTHLFFRNTGDNYWFGDRILPTFILE